MVGPSLVPDVIDRIVEILRGHPNLTNVSVLDGPELSGDFKSVAMMIGYTDGDRSTATVSRVAPRGLRPNDEETFSITGVISAVDGSTNADACRKARRAAADAFAVVQEVVTTDPTLGGTCGYIAIGDQEWWQAPTPDGIEATILFRLNGKALL